jgi:superfamily II DNA or RNA helicase
MTGLALRDYQEDALHAVHAAWDRGVRRPAVVLPTGTGKTVCFAHLVAREPGRSVILVHRDELARQTVDKVQAVTGIEPGTVKADRDETDARVVVASVQTLANPARRERLRDVTLVVVDEAHHAVALSWRAVIDQLDTRTVGFTATMSRGDGVALRQVWDEIVYQRDIVSMIRLGHLADVEGIRVDVADLDLSGVRMAGGDFSEGDLGRAIMAYREHAGDRPGILFAPTVETAQIFAEALNEAGITTAVVYGAMPLDKRRKILRDYERGLIQVLSNCMVLTEGYDSPRAQVCVIARLTASEPLFIQMVGRVLRPYPGKASALVLDVVGATGKHALVTLARLGGLKGEVVPGTTLLAALDEEEAETGRAEREWREGPVESRTVDLFAGSRQRWLQTRDGWWFMPGDKRYITIQPARGDGWDVASWNVPRGGRWLSREIASIELAMALGEADITEDEQLYASRHRAWRKRPASQKQLAFLSSLSRTVPEGVTRAGDVGDLISIALASRRIDPGLRRYLEAS